ncbi:MAG: tryptophan synthase subunit alpha [Planctomycetota bacterium]
MPTLAETFAATRTEGRLAFMPFVTAGDPDFAATGDVIADFAGRGVDLIEVGFPYSDPIADGPVIQASYARVLEGGFTLDGLFDAAGKITVPTPRVGMASYSLIHRYGVEHFLKRARSSNFGGLIVPDLPGDESGDLVSRAADAGLDLVQLVSPLTPPGRAEKIVADCRGFVYCIAVAGVTGERDGLPDELIAHLDRLRGMADLPLAVGFGISKPEQVAMLKGHCDGVIVGSAIVRRFEAFATRGRAEVLGELGEYVSSMVAACRG